MWILLACGSAFFAGLTAVLAKLGIRHTDSTVATALRTIVVLAAAWLMVLIVGSQDQVARIDGRTFVFLVLSGLATGASWLCYFRALQLGDVSRVVPVDKLSTVLTVILAVLLLGESLTRVGLGGVVLMTTGTFLMLDAADLRALPRAVAHGGGWLPWALGSAVFAALTAVLGKIGITDVESNLGTAVRTGVVLVMAWMMVLVTGKRERVRRVPRDELGWIAASGLATGASWLCYFSALQKGPASLVVPIDKLSILVTVVFCVIVLHERQGRRSLTGLALLVIGTALMVVA
mgnify:FL=1|jgi:hypothetical protein